VFSKKALRKRMFSNGSLTRNLHLIINNFYYYNTHLILLQIKIRNFLNFLSIPRKNDDLTPEKKP